MSRPQYLSHVVFGEVNLPAVHPVEYLAEGPLRHQTYPVLLVVVFNLEKFLEETASTVRTGPGGWVISGIVQSLPFSQTEAVYYSLHFFVATYWP